MRNEIKKIIKLKENTKIDGNLVNYYHIYFVMDEGTLDFKGALIEEHIIQNIPKYKVKPFGFMTGSNIFYITPSLYKSTNKLLEQVNWLKDLTDIEIEHILHGVDYETKNKLVI